MHMVILRRTKQSSATAINVPWSCVSQTMLALNFWSGYASFVPSALTCSFIAYFAVELSSVYSLLQLLFSIIPPCVLVGIVQNRPHKVGDPILPIFVIRFCFGSVLVSSIGARYQCRQVFPSQMNHSANLVGEPLLVLSAALTDFVVQYFLYHFYQAVCWNCVV